MLQADSPSAGRKLSAVRSQQNLVLRTPRSAAGSTLCKPDMKLSPFSPENPSQLFGQLSSLTQKLNGVVGELSYFVERASTPLSSSRKPSVFMTDVTISKDESAAEMAAKNEAVIQEMLEHLQKARDRLGVGSNNVLPPLKKPTASNKLNKKKATFHIMPVDFDGTAHSIHEAPTGGKTPFSRNNLSTPHTGNISNFGNITSGNNFLSPSAERSGESDQFDFPVMNKLYPPRNFAVIERNIEIAKQWHITHSQEATAKRHEDKKQHEKVVYLRNLEMQEKLASYHIAKQQHKDTVSQKMIMLSKHAAFFERVNEWTAVYWAITYWQRLQVLWKDLLAGIDRHKVEQRAAIVIQRNLRRIYKYYMRRKVFSAFPRDSPARRRVQGFLHKWHADYVETAAARLRSYLVGCAYTRKMSLHVHMFMMKVRRLQRFARKNAIRTNWMLFILTKQWMKVETEVLTNWEKKVVDDAWLVIDTRKQQRLKHIQDQERSAKMHGKKAMIASKPEIGGVKVSNKAVHASIHDPRLAAQWAEIVTLVMDNDSICKEDIREHMKAVGLCPVLKNSTEQQQLTDLKQALSERNVIVRQAVEKWTLESEDSSRKQSPESEDGQRKTITSAGGKTGWSKAMQPTKLPPRPRVPVLLTQADMSRRVRTALIVMNSGLYPTEVLATL